MKKQTFPEGKKKVSCSPNEGLKCILQGFFLLHFTAVSEVLCE